MLAKFDSLKNHVQNIHTGHSEHFKECLHAPIQEDGRRKKWLKPGSKACEKLCDLLENTRLRKDIQKLSPHAQTSGVESFHATILHFAPKLLGYSYNGMLSRVILAVLHYNENAGRTAAKDMDGNERFSFEFPRVWIHTKESLDRCNIW
ncbi:uncharacterized protein LOC117109200 [Anneissia japonica]|uniref:uncharacterized protein LOC117109200 n=1 Tax=Anneissia japonica TaxID=1529436 RepID=UPI001425B89A|nr:uncharacterized protein LOC117109200 [Anneissia japonica]